MSFKCEVKDQSPQPTLAIRTVVPVEQLPEFLGRAYQAIFQYMTELQEQPAGPPFTAYYNMDMQNLDVEAGFPVGRILLGKDDIRCTVIPAGKYASCIHTGPYKEVGPAYEALGQWALENGYEPTGVAYEIYLNDPSETPAEKLMTQVTFALKPKA